MQGHFGAFHTHTRIRLLRAPRPRRTDWRRYFGVRALDLVARTVRTLVTDRRKHVGAALVDGPAALATLGDVWSLAVSPANVMRARARGSAPAELMFGPFPGAKPLRVQL